MDAFHATKLATAIDITLNPYVCIVNGYLCTLRFTQLMPVYMVVLIADWRTVQL